MYFNKSLNKVPILHKPNSFPKNLVDFVPNPNQTMTVRQLHETNVSSGERCIYCM